ncbi:MAG: hypothetical protein ABL973_06650 [Micropepsaceae bacterium]
MLRPIIFALAAIAIAAPALARPINGTWTIERMERAPWTETNYVPDQTIANHYLRKNVNFDKARIVGPDLLACRRPNYKYDDIPADMMFQGGLADNQSDNSLAIKRAQALGFSRPLIHTVTTDCEHDIAFHLKDDNHAAFALDNMIFWLTRKP